VFLSADDAPNGPQHRCPRQHAAVDRNVRRQQHRARLCQRLGQMLAVVGQTGGVVEIMAHLQPLQYLGFERFSNKQIHDFAGDS
jgi:hypothetical protein